VQGGAGSASSAAGRGGQPSWGAQWPQSPIRGVFRRDTQRFGDGAGVFVEVEPEHRTAQRPQSKFAALDIQVNF
jgi:hypothetical protein